MAGSASPTSSSGTLGTSRSGSAVGSSNGGVRSIRRGLNVGPDDASPFIKPDRMRRNFLRSRMGSKASQNGGLIGVKKEDPEYMAQRERELLEIGVEADMTKVKTEADDEFNEFPLRAVPRESLENMRTHLIKFQSKKNIVPSEDFHLPIRLHRKDTRNLQFQLTRAEIVQRQKEIAEYKDRLDQEKLGSRKPQGTLANVGSPNDQNQVSTPNLTVSNINQARSSNTTPEPIARPLSVAASPVANPLSKDASPGGQEHEIPVVTKLEEAGIAKDPTKVGMVTYDGKEVDVEKIAQDGSMDPLAEVAPDGGGRSKRGVSRRKTRQLKVLDENAKKLRFEEFYPWVMEDFDGYNTWVGSYEAGNSDSYVLLSVEDDGSFTMIPADKVYKFTARNKYATLTIEEAEKRMDKKNGEVPRWLMKHLDDIGTTTTRYDRTKRKLKAVADQKAMEGDEDRSDNSEIELDYDEEFADDEEAPIIDFNEQENKESEQRIKREMLQANAMGLRDDEAGGEETDDLFNEKKIDEEGEKIKKALQKTELAALYPSDNDDNPYLSESDLENKDEDGVIKKEDGAPSSKKSSPRKASPVSTVISNGKNRAPSKEPKFKVKSIKNCVIILKGNKTLLRDFPPGEWNPEAAKQLKESEHGIMISGNSGTEFESESAVTVKSEVGSVPASQNPDQEAFIPLITDQDIIDAIGKGKVNVKEFGKNIRRKYPGSENKKRMFAIVKRLCRKVDDEHMELKR